MGLYPEGVPQAYHTYTIFQSFEVMLFHRYFIVIFPCGIEHAVDRKISYALITRYIGHLALRWTI